MSEGVPRINMQSLLKEGTKSYEGLEEAVFRNTRACTELADMTRTSFGPNGLSKMISTSLEQLYVTKDAATMVHQMEVQHPAAAIVVNASINQSAEFGDGTNLVIMFAGELLRRAESLMHQGLKASDVISGYERAADLLFEQMPELVTRTVSEEEVRDAVKLAALLRPVVGAKHAGYADLLARLSAEAVVEVLPKNGRAGDVNLDNVRVAKVPGQSPTDSHVLRGMVLQRQSETSVREVLEPCKVAVFGAAIEAEMTEAKAKVVLESADDLTKFSTSEEDRMREQVQKLAEMGVKVAVSGSSVSELAAHYLSLSGILAFRIPSKFELARFARTVGAHINVKWCVPSKESLGSIDSLRSIELGGNQAIVVDSDHDGGVSTIVLRAATKNMLDDLERAIDNGVNVARTLARDGRVVPGAGATELILQQRIATIAARERSLDQYAMREFAQALEIVPRTLAETSGLDPSTTLANLHAACANGKIVGVNIEALNESEAAVDPIEKGIVDSFVVKEWALRLAIEAAITICNVDQVIRSRRAGALQPRAPGARDQ